MKNNCPNNKTIKEEINYNRINSLVYKQKL